MGQLVGRALRLVRNVCVALQKSRKMDQGPRKHAIDTFPELASHSNVSTHDSTAKKRGRKSTEAHLGVGTEIDGSQGLGLGHGAVKLVLAGLDPVLEVLEDLQIGLRAVKVGLWMCLGWHGIRVLIKGLLWTGIGVGARLRVPGGVLCGGGDEEGAVGELCEGCDRALAMKRIPFSFVVSC